MRLDEFSSEVLIEILSYIEPTDVSSCLTVNKHFHQSICTFGNRLQRHSANMDISYISESEVKDPKVEPTYRLNVNVFKLHCPARKTLNVDFHSTKMIISGTMADSFINSLSFDREFTRTEHRDRGLREVHHSLAYDLGQRKEFFRTTFSCIFSPTVNCDRIKYEESAAGSDSADFSEFLTVVQDALQARPRQAIKMTSLNIKNDISDCHRGIFRMIDQERLQWCSIALSKEAPHARSVAALSRDDDSLEDIRRAIRASELSWEASFANAMAMMAILPKNSSKWLNLSVPAVTYNLFEAIRNFLMEWKSGARKISKFNLRSVTFNGGTEVSQNIIDGIGRTFKCDIRPEGPAHIGSFGRDIDQEKLHFRLEPSCFMFTTNN